MNKYKKIATAVVSLVLAGTMVGSMAACNNNKTTSYNLQVKTDANGKLTYADGTTVNLNIGNQSGTTPAYTSFTSTYDISGTIRLIDGKTYSSGSLRPAWQAVSDKLKINLVDKFQNKSSNVQITDPLNNRNINQFDIISGSLAAINENSGNNNFVNLAEYLDYMPNYKAFLDENPVTVYSLTGEASGANAGAMYAAPYFDGNNDIENYALIRKDWVSKLLDSSSLPASGFTTFAAQAKAKDTPSGKTERTNSIIGEKTSIENYMGSENYEIDVVNSEGKLQKITVAYSKALAAAKEDGSALNTALKAAGAGVTQEKIDELKSGNIVDIQNLAINATNGEVTGNVLAKIVREYILVAYVDANETPFYTTDNGYKPSDVFNSVAAAWDVDILAATLRAVVTAKADKNHGGVFEEIEGGNVWGIVARIAKTQRRVNLYALAAELYGVRGMESRLEYLYVGADGELHDAREDEESYDLISKFSAFAKEGILYTGANGVDGKNSYYNGDTDAILGAMSYDYVQTQTRYAITGEATEGYDYAPILTPVSKWDVDGDGKHTDIMRFTESWRSVKNTGFCVPSAAVSDNPDKLSAVLTLIDYMFSEDGQMLLTYGTPSSTNSYTETGSGSNVKGTANDNGWWIGEPNKSELTLAEVADVKVEGYGQIPTQYKVKDAYKTQVFVYDGEVYEGVEYGGRVVPQITDANFALFKGIEITIGTTGDKIQQGKGNIQKISQVGNYTNYARLILGTTMPVGNKNQGFEYQCTAVCGRDGAQIVDAAIQAGAIKHVVTDPAKAETPWYFISPTVFPLTSGNRTILSNSAQGLLSGTYFVNSSSSNINIYIDLIYYGLGSKTFLGSATNIAEDTTAGTLKESGKAYIEFLNSGKLNNALTQRVNVYKNAWKNLKTLYKIDL